MCVSKQIRSGPATTSCKGLPSVVSAAQPERRITARNLAKSSREENVAFDALDSAMFRFNLEAEGPKVVCGQMAKILIIVYQEHVKPVGLARRNSWSRG